jgi:hypothetical protein
MKPLNPEEASSYLKQIGMKIGAWNRVDLLDDGLKQDRTWFNFPAPGDAKALWHFSALLGDWLPRGEWRILQFDNSNHFPRVAELFLSRVVGATQPVDFNASPTLFFEDVDDEALVQNSSVLTFFVFNLLMFEGHAYIVSSADGGYRLGIQDGYVYFEGTNDAVSHGREIVKRFESAAIADWANDVEAAWQERQIAETAGNK